MVAKSEDSYTAEHYLSNKNLRNSKMFLSVFEILKIKFWITASLKKKGWASLVNYCVCIAIVWKLVNRTAFIMKWNLSSECAQNGRAYRYLSINYKVVLFLPIYVKARAQVSVTKKFDQGGSIAYESVRLYPIKIVARSRN